MKIFYTASYYGKNKYQKYYDMVLHAIQDSESEIISPELSNYLELLPPDSIEKLKDKRSIHYEAIKEGILWADLVIIELSHEDFQLGHEATLAIQNKKPVLCLSINEDFSLKIKNPFFFGAKYNKYNINEIIRNFILHFEVRKGHVPYIF